LARQPGPFFRADDRMSTHGGDRITHVHHENKQDDADYEKKWETLQETTQNISAH
jgi:hypothetical protein